MYFISNKLFDKRKICQSLKDLVLRRDLNLNEAITLEK